MVLLVPIESGWSGDYKIKYNGAQVDLVGKRSSDRQDSILKPAVIEETGINPDIVRVDSKLIYIKF